VVRWRYPARCVIAALSQPIGTDAYHPTIEVDDDAMLCPRADDFASDNVAVDDQLRGCIFKRTTSLGHEYVSLVCKSERRAGRILFYRTSARITDASDSSCSRCVLLTRYKGEQGPHCTHTYAQVLPCGDLDDAFLWRV
jgi:hypothetical protein